MFVYSHLTLLILLYFPMSLCYLFFYVLCIFVLLFYCLFLFYLLLCFIIYFLFIYLLLNRFFFSIPYGLWDLSSLTRNLTWVLAVKVFNHWTAREFPKEIFLMFHLIPLLICSVIFLVVGLVITESTFNPSQFPVTSS